VETKLARAMLAMAYTLDNVKELCKVNKKLSSVFDQITEVFQLMSSASRELNNTRRESMKRDLKQCYRPICN